MKESPDRWQLVLSGTLIAAGTLLFLSGGAFHPQAGPNLGPVGSAEYWRAFAAEIANHHSWDPIHARILAGPILWALGAIGLTAALRDRGARHVADHARVTLAMGAALWGVTFVVDGWLAPRYAHAITAAVAAADPASTAGATLGFQVNQEFVVRLGLVSWLLLNLGMGALALGVRNAGAWGRRTDRVLMVSGVLLALWTLGLWTSGEFVPGPFTSRFWTTNAVLVGLWYLVLGAIVAFKPIRAHPGE